MNVFPFGPAILERLYIRFSKKVIFDIEDNLLSNEQGSINWLASVLKSKSKAIFLIKNADHVIASSPDLADQCNSISGNNNATFIPPTLDDQRFFPKIKRHDSTPFMVAWLQSTFCKNTYSALILDRRRWIGEVGGG